MGRPDSNDTPLYFDVQIGMGAAGKRAAKMGDAVHESVRAADSEAANEVARGFDQLLTMQAGDVRGEGRGWDTKARAGHLLRHFFELCSFWGAKNSDDDSLESPTGRQPVACRPSPPSASESAPAPSAYPFSSLLSRVMDLYADLPSAKSGASLPGEAPRARRACDRQPRVLVSALHRAPLLRPLFARQLPRRRLPRLCPPRAPRR